MLQFKKENEKRVKKVLIYGLDNSGKSTYAEKYCKENGLKPVLVDIEETNFTDVPSVIFERGSSMKVKDQLVTIIREVAKSDYDTIIIDGLSSLLQLLVSNANGLKAYSDRSSNLNNITNALIKSKLNFILIGQIDLEVERKDGSEPSVAVVNLNAMVNEKYFCVNENGNYKVEVKKFRSVAKKGQEGDSRT